MLEDELFEGWLSVPSIESFFVGAQPSSKEERTPTPAAGLQNEHNSTISLVPCAAAVAGHQLTPGASNDDTNTEFAARKRRGHTKSRLGCVACKKRKIKCQETYPACGNCLRRGYPCRYPTVFNHAQHDRIVSEVLNNPRQFVRLSDTPKPATYNANDMRVFHHFLTAAHPCIPAEYETVWVKDVPALSHQCEYLMHGLLAMAGSHLNLFTDGPSPNQVLVHRQKAIEGLEEAFTRWPPRPHEAHIMLATSYLLAFQSSYMPDGLLDHVLSLRGCSLLAQMILANRLEGAFSVKPDVHGTWFELRMKSSMERLDQGLAREALQSMAAFAPRLASSKDHDIERAILAQLVEVVRALLVPLSQSSASERSTPDLTDATTASPVTDCCGRAMFNSLLTQQSVIQKSKRPTDATAASPALGSCGRTTLTFPSTYLPDIQIKNPLFPAPLALDFSDISSWDTITNIPSDQVPDPYRSFNALMSSLLILTTWPREAVLRLLSGSDVLGNIVMAHFCAVRFIVAPLSAPEAAKQTPMKAMVEWCEKVTDAVEDDQDVKWTEYIEWPRKILGTLRSCLSQKRDLTFGDLYDILINDPGVFREGQQWKP